MCYGNNPPPVTPPATPPVGHTIVLNVDVETIPAPTTESLNVDSYCEFVGKSDEVLNENFEIEVANGDTVT